MLALRRGRWRVLLFYVGPVLKSSLSAFIHTQNEEDFRQISPGSTNHNNFLLMNFICRHSIKYLTKLAKFQSKSIPAICSNRREEK